MVIVLSLRQGWTADGWRYSIYWNETAGFTVVFANESKEVWALDDVRIEKIDKDRYGAFVEGELHASISLGKVVSSIAERIAYRLEHDGSWVIRGEAVLKEEMERIRELGLRPEGVVRKRVVPPVLPFGRTRLVMEKTTPVKPMIVARVERERLRGRLTMRPPVPPKPRKLGLTGDAKRKLRVMFESFLYKTGIKPTSRLLTDFNFFLNTLEKGFLTWTEEEAYSQAKREVVSYFKNVYFKHFEL